MEKREQLDRLYEFSLVLLGILSAAELQYFLVTEKQELWFYALKVFTLPFLFLILLWLIKEIFKDFFHKQFFSMLFTEFCWSFWSVSLLYYLLGIVGGVTISVYLTFFLSLLLTFSISWAYKRAFTAEYLLETYHKNHIWIFRTFIIYCISYFLLLSIVMPIPSP